MASWLQRSWEFFRYLPRVQQRQPGRGAVVEFAFNREEERADEGARGEGTTPFASSLSMTRRDPSASFDVATLQRAIAEETAAETQRRGAAVPPHDPMVRERVCTRLLREAGRLHQGGEAAVFTELAAHEEEPLGSPWADRHAAA